MQSNVEIGLKTISNVSHRKVVIAICCEKTCSSKKKAGRCVLFESHILSENISDPIKAIKFKTNGGNMKLQKQNKRVGREETRCVNTGKVLPKYLYGYMIWDPRRVSRRETVVVNAFLLCEVKYLLWALSAEVRSTEMLTVLLNDFGEWFFWIGLN